MLLERAMRCMVCVEMLSQRQIGMVTTALPADTNGTVLGTSLTLRYQCPIVLRYDH